MNLLQFLNLAELGVGAAISYTLYKPLANKDAQQVNEVVSVQGYLYTIIGIIVIISAGILMLFFLSFSKINIPIWYTYATFGVLLFQLYLDIF